MKALVALAILIFSETGMAQTCPFQGFLDLEKQGPVTSNVGTQYADRVKWQDSLKQLFSKETENFFELYLTQSLTSESLACVSQSERLQDLIENNFSSLFLNFSAQRLAKSQSIPVQNFAQKIQQRLASGWVIPTHLYLHIGDHHPTEKPAGYDRSNKGIFFDLLKIDPANFNIYLIHEFAHAFDPKLAAAINTYNNSELSGAVAAMVRNKKTLTTLTAEEKAQLESYILAGLDRGVLAELRAWVTTSKLYQELRLNNEQTPVLFLDSIIGNSLTLTKDQLTQIWWKYLLANFTKPTDGLFASPLLQSALDEILNHIDPSQHL